MLPVEMVTRRPYRSQTFGRECAESEITREAPKFGIGSELLRKISYELTFDQNQQGWGNNSDQVY